MREISNIFLHFLNRDTQEIFGIISNLQASPQLEKANKERLKKGLNASVLLCDSQHHCVMPVGFWFETKYTRDLLQENAEFIKLGYIMLSIREDNLYSFIEKKREQYGPLNDLARGRQNYVAFFGNKVFKQLLDLNPMLLDRNTKIGRYCSEIWNSTHNLLIYQNMGELVSAYSSLGNDVTDILKIATQIRDVTRDPEAPFVWSNVSEMYSNIGIRDFTLLKRLRRIFERNYYRAYLAEYKATFLYDFYLLDKGIDFDLGFDSSSIANYRWFEEYLQAISLSGLLSAPAEKVSMVKQSASWGKILQQYVDLCNTESFQKDNTQRLAICKETIARNHYNDCINEIKEILVLNGKILTLEKQRHFVDVLIMVATVEEEEAILQNGDWEYQCTANGYGYYRRNEGLSFALARAIEMGGVAAATATQHFVEQLKPRFISMAGFCAGREGSVNLGDVFVPIKIYDYDNGGKQLSEDTVLPEINLTQLDPLWRQKIERLGSEWREKIDIDKPIPYEPQFVGLLKMLIENNYSISLDALRSLTQYPDLTQIISKEINNGHLELNDLIISVTPSAKKQYVEDYFLKYSNYKEPELKVRMGALATGNKVQQWGEIFDKLTKQYDRKTYAIDMEGFAVSQVAAFQHTPCIIAKGVGDFASENKAFDNRYVSYAVYSAYRFLISFFNSLKSQELLGK